MTCKALIVEDSSDTIATINDVLDSLEHTGEVVQSQVDAIKRLKASDYAYMLCNISIRARAGNGEPRIQNTENLLEKMSLLSDRTMPPVILMSDYATNTIEETVDVVRLGFSMHSRGVVDIIAKPLAGKGRTLDRVIKKVLSGKIEPVKITWPEVSDPKNIPSTESAEPNNSSAKKDRISHDEKPWASIPNEAIEIDNFMAKYCEHRTKENRKFRKRALLAAARHGTISLPSLAGERKHGQANKYHIHDLLSSWQGFLDEGVDLPPLLRMCQAH